MKFGKKQEKFVSIVAMDTATIVVSDQLEDPECVLAYMIISYLILTSSMLQRVVLEFEDGNIESCVKYMNDNIDSKNEILERVACDYCISCFCVLDRGDNCDHKCQLCRDEAAK